ncbi:DUF7312 domain-containing protein [Natrinema salaciae]|uniref:DUF7312 domain-containing protein n=1 Tax=Natrinema salaciae TaxID=1186196 RepID=A0A1H9Q6R8_9EURY|nr:hypothetical protein [Natrinema salaciae]SER56140.1 hypothetical protein SAMN04489841_4102 [Natrinema salaciae]
MADDPSGNDDATDDRWGDPSAEPDVGTAADSNEGPDIADRTDRPSGDGRSDGDEHARIPLDLSGSSDESDEDAAADEYGPEASSTPIEPGDPDLENALFVILGALAMVFVIARLVMIPLG